MCFGNKEKQGTDNSCGGYALNAVLLDMKSDPIGTYKQIQEIQQSTLKERSISAQFIEKTAFPKSNMSLPSSIVLTALEKDLDVAVYIDEEVLEEVLEKIFEEEFEKVLEKGFVQELIKEEKEKLDNTLRETKIPVSSSELLDCSYFIVLVSNATHWVAVKKNGSGSYICYDPGTGSAYKEESTIQLAVAAAAAKYKANSLIIALRRK